MLIRARSRFLSGLAGSQWAKETNSLNKRPSRAKRASATTTGSVLTHMANATLPSALAFHFCVRRMESGGSIARYRRRANSLNQKADSKFFLYSSEQSTSLLKTIGCCMVKPLGSLVQVSSTYHFTHPSPINVVVFNGLQRDLNPRMTHLVAPFPLRCFQRLSFRT